MLVRQSDSDLGPWAEGISFPLTSNMLSFIPYKKWVILIVRFFTKP